MVGRSDSVRGKPEILSRELAKDEDAETDEEEGYIETVVRTEKRKVCFRLDCADSRFVETGRKTEVQQCKFSTWTSQMKEFKLPLPRRQFQHKLLRRPSKLHWHISYTPINLATPLNPSVTKSTHWQKDLDPKNPSSMNSSNAPNLKASVNPQ
jgi:hypothetical protein